MSQTYDMSDLPRVVLRLRSRSYSEQEQRLLTAAVGGDFEVELRPAKMPEAGGTAELWGFLQSPQGWIVSAALSGLAYDALKGLGRRLAECIRRVCDAAQSASAARRVVPAVYDAQRIGLSQPG